MGLGVSIRSSLFAYSSDLFLMLLYQVGSETEKHHDGLFLEDVCMSAMLCIAGLSIASILYQVFFSFLIYSLT